MAKRKNRRAQREKVANRFANLDRDLAVVAAKIEAQARRATPSFMTLDELAVDLTAKRYRLRRLARAAMRLPEEPNEL